MMKSRILFILSVILTLLFLNCSGGGTGSEIEGRCAISGQAVYENGKPVSGAMVRIRPAQYLALDSSVAAYSFDTVTDKEGMFYFNSVGVDSYTIEINKSGKYGRLIPFVVNTENELPIVIPAAKLEPTGTIHGRINLPISDDSLRPLICIYGVEYLEMTQVTQEFSFTGIPSGTYDLRIIPCKISNLMLTLQRLKVKSDSITDVGILNLNLQQFFKGCGSWECDSLAVRSLLDSNHLFNVDVHSVVEKDLSSSRVVTLSLAGRNISTLTKNIGSLSKLKKLDVCNNIISKLPYEIGYLGSLAVLMADSNELLRLPAELSFCDSLKILSLRNNNLFEFSNDFIISRVTWLDLRNNRLQTIPEQICAMKNLRILKLDNNELTDLPQSIVTVDLLEFSCRYNRLCSVSEMVKTWMTRFDSSWTGLQRCE
jgi:hypothetical protein